MTHRISIVHILMLAALLLVGGGGGVAEAQAQIYVLESTAASVKAGTALAVGDRLAIPAGASVRIVMPSGKTQMIKGPYSGSAGELAAGQKANDGVISWLMTLVQTGGSNEKTAGATRSMRAAAPSTSFSWTAIPTSMDSTICVPKGAKLQLERTSSQAADRVTVVDLTTTTRADAEFAAGSETAAWPGTIAPLDERTYVLLAPDNRPRRQLTLRIIDRAPADEDILVELANRGCRHQFDAWVKEKVGAAK